MGVKWGDNVTQLKPRHGHVFTIHGVDILAAVIAGLPDQTAQAWADQPTSEEGTR